MKNRYTLPWLVSLLLCCLFMAPSISWAASSPNSNPLNLPEVILKSKAAILMDYATGIVYYEKNAHTPLPPASVTKIMTLTLALEALRDGKVTLDTMVSTSALAASMGGTQIWLEPGEQMSFNDLLYAIAVGSANDAAVAVAEHIGGSEQAFVDLMNARAKALGMKNSHWSNPSGLPPEDVGKTEAHVTTAYDLALLSRYALGLPLFHELTSTYGPVLMRANTKRQPELWNFNKMLKQYNGLDGIKTGMTNEAGFCLVATAIRDDLRLIAVALGAPSSSERNNDITKLLDLGFGALKAIKVASAGEKIGELAVPRGSSPSVAVTPTKDVIVTLPRTSQSQPQTQIVSHNVAAPLTKGQAVAELIVSLDGVEVSRTDLVALVDVPRGSVWQIMLQTVKQVTGGKK
jgi:D-alanyl-D-alanine carboxypeptidase (penicillin-binding protein 5/6)